MPGKLQGGDHVFLLLLGGLLFSLFVFKNLWEFMLMMRSCWNLLLLFLVLSLMWLQSKATMTLREKYYSTLFLG